MQVLQYRGLSPLTPVLNSVPRWKHFSAAHMQHNTVRRGTHLRTAHQHLCGNGPKQHEYATQKLVLRMSTYTYDISVYYCSTQGDVYKNDIKE